MPKSSPTARAKRIKLLLMDVDGVLTDGKLYYFETRPGVIEETKGFDAKDGIGLMLARLAGLRLGLISGRRSTGVEHRAQLLDIEFVFQGATKKLPVYESILAQTGLSDAEVAMVGDDLPDLPILKRVGLGVAVQDAVPELKKAAHLVTRRPGGRGAVRETVELILKSQGSWERALRERGVL
jgi:3-deoxy-D-manno-octulosonate 8-phosphate phosphatase (KDO 8-P phosphatase)